MYILWFRLEFLFKNSLILCMGNEGKKHGIAENWLAVLLFLLHSAQNSLLFQELNIFADTANM